MFINKNKLYYGWIIVAVGFFTVLSSLGLARFAYGMLIPSMRQALNLTFDQTGFISSANFAGYLVSVAFAPYLIKKMKPRASIALGLFIIAVCMLFISRAQNYYTIMLLYALTGIGSGMANIIIMLLVSHWFLKSKRGRATGFMVTGNGVAIISAGFFIPFINKLAGIDGWRISWMIMSVSTAFIAFFAAVFLRNTPEELGLNPLGTGSSSFNSEKKTATGLILLKLGILYLIFGITYVVYGTFIVSTIISDYGFTETAAGVFWSVVGFFGMFSGIGFGAFSDRYGRKYGLAVVFAVQTAAYLLAGSAYSGLTLGASVFLYGISAFSIPTIMAAAMGDYFGASKAAVSFSIITLFFAAGQTGGPAAAGIFAQQTGSFAQSFIFCGFLTAAAAFISLILPNTD